jgi:ABC-type uncharacterized transport system involved in gliding motility auxiliary subunit
LNNFFHIASIVINKNLHQSKAGIGNKLNTHKFILIIAIKIIIKTAHCDRVFDTRLTTHIGQLTLFKASCLSSSFSGLTNFLTKLHSASKVNKLWL